MNLEAQKPQEPGEDGEGHVAAAPEGAPNGAAAAPENASNGTIDPYEQISQLPHSESDEEQRDDPSNTQQPLPEGEANELSPQAVPQLHCPSCENAITSIQDLRSVASVGLICSKCATSIESPLNLEAQKPQEPGEDGEGHVAAAPESAENGDVAVGQAVLSQKRKKGGRTGESAKRVYQKRKKGGRTGESAKRVYRAQPIFVPIGLLDGDELRRERWVVTEPGTHQVATQHGTNHCLHIGDRWLTGHLVRPGAVTPAFEGISRICQEDVRVGLSVGTVV